MILVEDRALEVFVLRIDAGIENSRNRPGALDPRTVDRIGSRHLQALQEPTPALEVQPKLPDPRSLLEPQKGRGVAELENHNRRVPVPVAQAAIPAKNGLQQELLAALKLAATNPWEIFFQRGIDQLNADKGAAPLLKPLRYFREVPGRLRRDGMFKRNTPVKHKACN